ncbi:uncharacterized protein LOC128549615 [Mercenaria mercenaria]|uniref:uncharacterized protein LOC128549615 n=1 Tax=Mercenaria mercenaria TaxID=6596 RepID=UPI00234EB4EB|nr:uncharacterized protein LOC128549615 [Mercenaria mercenaria]
MKLKSIFRDFLLEPDETVSLNMTFFLPKDLETKSYYLAIVCDSRDDLYEENENDNVKRIVFDLTESVSTDIVVKQVKSPSFVEYGNEITVTWDLINNGTNSASGYKCDSVYLSEDRMWDIEDSQVGEPSCQSFSLAANQTDQLHFSLRYKIPHVTARYYSTLVKSRTNVIDIHIDNNVGVSENKTRVAYQSVTTGTSTSMKLLADQFLSVQIINVSADETLIVNVTSNKVNAFNNIFLKSSSPATLYDFEIASDNPNLPNQIVSVPNTLSTDYYILVENSGFLTQKVEQNVTISVKYATFEIIDVFPKSAITGAQTTLYIKGTLFPYDMQARLNSSNDVFTAKSIYVFSSTEAYVSFDIPLNIPESNFSLFLSSTSLNQTIVFNEEISVGSGTNGFLFTNVETTARIRTGETGTVKLEIQNRGDSDLLVPIIKVEALGDGSLRLMDETFDGFYRNRFYLFGSPEQGPAGLLRPNARSSLTFKSQQKDLIFQRSEVKKMKLSVYEIVQSIDTPNPFLEMKEDMRPSHYNAEQWMPVWNNFITMTGNNTLSLASKMSAVLTEMSLAGRYVWKVDSILKYLVDFADAPYGGRTLQIETDFDVQSDANVRLVIDRFLSARIGSRKQPGYIGPGWILPLWDTKIKAIYESELTFTLEKEDYVFVKVDDNIYIHKKLGAITETATEFVLRRYQDNKEFHFDSETLTLRSILSLTDSSSLHFEYEKSLLTKIRHSEGPYVLVKYNTKHLIQSMELLNTTSPETITKVLYLYDFDTGVLSQTRSDSGTTRYHYKRLLHCLPSLEGLFENDGKQLIVEDGNGDKIKTIFNEKYQLTTFVDGQGNKYDIVINENGTLRNLKYPDGTNKTYRYIQNGHITTTHSGATKRYEYNDRKQLLMKDIGNNSITTYAYDETGNLIRAVNENGEIEIAYRDTKVASIKYPENTIDYQYDENKQVTRITTSNGYHVTYKYNEHGQLQKIIDKENNVLLEAEYNSMGKITKRLLGNHANTEYEYDTVTGLLKVLRNFYPNGTLASFFNYTYSTRMRRIAVDTLEGTWKFKYDRAGQVISMTDPKGNVTEYEYDNAKNRKIISINGVDAQSTINEMNQYIKYRDMVFKYDKNGNLVQRNGSIQEKFVFDEENRIVAYKSNTDQCDFKYDALGNLYMKTCNGRSARFVINPAGNYDMDILEQINTRAGKETSIYYYHGGVQIGLVAARHDDHTLNYFMYDPLGSVTNKLDESGNLASIFIISEILIGEFFQLQKIYTNEKVTVKRPLDREVREIVMVLHNGFDLWIPNGHIWTTVMEERAFIPKSP